MNQFALNLEKKNDEKVYVKYAYIDPINEEAFLISLLQKVSKIKEITIIFHGDKEKVVYEAFKDIFAEKDESS